MHSTMKLDVKPYVKLLKCYIDTRDKSYLYKAEQVSKSFIDKKISPEEMIRLHIQALEELFPCLSVEHKLSLEFLLEAMISYRVAYEEMQRIKEEQLELKLEIQVAANMQKNFLATTIPEIDGLEIGVVSVPYHQMNGDYYHFVKGDDGKLGVAIADVIGKGVPAALSMSMIKYSMDSIEEEPMSPKLVLENLNRVVERNVASNMFITMFYAQYIPSTCQLQFASAGHEPGFYYHAENKTYEEITAKGLVLGVLPNTRYQQYEMNIQKEDMIILLTDGVTECRYGERFIKREEVLEVIELYSHLPPQEQVNQVYRHFESQENFQLRDDFTLIIMKRTV